VLLANFGIFSRVLKRREAGQRFLPDGKGGRRLYDCKADYELLIGSESRERFMSEIGFITEEKTRKYEEWREQRSSSRVENFVSRIATIEYVGREAVFDTTQPDRNNLVFNGFVTGNCGEQPLPPYGSCLLGSINLTRFVVDPFTDTARFDWEEFRKTVKVFTRMLDNVVEINGLPLGQQRDEITRKRRHGMGFLGLGSAITMMVLVFSSAVTSALGVSTVSMGALSASGALFWPPSIAPPSGPRCRAGRVVELSPARRFPFRRRGLAR
jgi:ribonucleoside-diphosphate reductase alpha chain